MVQKVYLRIILYFTIMYIFLRKYYFLFSFSVPSVSISGDKEIHVESSSSIVLKCNVKDYVLKPNHIWWFLNNERLLDGVNGVTVEDNVISSYETTSKSIGKSHFSSKLHHLIQNYTTRWQFEVR